MLSPIDAGKVGGDVTIWDYMGIYGTIWDSLGLSRTIWDYLGLLWVYLGLSQTRVQVEAGESKLLLFETVWFTIFFLSRTSYRGACAPKNWFKTQILRAKIKYCLSCLEAWLTLLIVLGVTCTV